MEKNNPAGEPFYRDADFADVAIVKGEDVHLSCEGASQVRHVYVQFSDEAPPSWQDYPNEYNEEDNWFSLDAEKAQQMTAELVEAIAAGAVDSFLFSFEPWGEGHWLCGEFAGGWATVFYDDFEEETSYHICNPDFDTVEVLAPVSIGGQTPVPKRFAVEDFALVARIAAHFLQTGQLQPGTQWAQNALG